ncbi:hypothetical protein SAMN05421636_101563 [Pricia antarctica]|uniref:Uncharacterized protein n=1 Tax=Pricia antarctica TaxID=641691 RepID=A0A1G6X7Q6_9FLAO|nr:hypothetical protein SAMN05421636_101563 [Pricia antarctica]
MIGIFISMGVFLLSETRQNGNFIEPYREPVSLTEDTQLKISLKLKTVSSRTPFSVFLTVQISLRASCSKNR